jgi:hypothetical protein
VECEKTKSPVFALIRTNQAVVSIHSPTGPPILLEIRLVPIAVGIMWAEDVENNEGNVKLQN